MLHTYYFFSYCSPVPLSRNNGRQLKITRYNTFCLSILEWCFCSNAKYFNYSCPYGNKQFATGIGRPMNDIIFHQGCKKKNHSILCVFPRTILQSVKKKKERETAMARTGMYFMLHQLSRNLFQLQRCILKNVSAGKKKYIWQQAGEEKHALGTFT